MMFTLGVKNLRRLQDVAPIDLKPITLLVGRNSSGKSSFLRALPLLRQSVMTRTSSPILWFGDFVDFGSFLGAVSDNDLSKSISFSFGLDAVRFGGTTVSYYSGHILRQSTTTISDVQLEVSLAEVDSLARIKDVFLTAQDGKISYKLTVNSDGTAVSLVVNGKEAISLFKNTKMILSQGSIFPDIVVATEEDVASSPYFRPDEPSVAYAVAEVIAPHLDKRTRKEVVLSLASELLVQPSYDRETIQRLVTRTNNRSWKKVLTDMAAKDNRGLYQQIEYFYQVSRFVPLLRAVNLTLKQIVSEILYIGPARARSERYYRLQDLSVSEIDPDGKNFAMFLKSLNKTSIDKLSDWVEQLFGYRIDLQESSGHVSITLVEGSSKTNIVDTGYGVSQILPVLGQIWWASNRERAFRNNRGDNISILAIEQPELHLHPAHQALLADAIVEAPVALRGRTSRVRTHFVIETHSETMVNRLGELVADGKLAAEDVQIVLFEPSFDSERVTNVRTARFGPSGELVDWPYGFFQA